MRRLIHELSHQDYTVWYSFLDFRLKTLKAAVDISKFEMEESIEEGLIEELTENSDDCVGLTTINISSIRTTSPLMLIKSYVNKH